VVRETSKEREEFPPEIYKPEARAKVIFKIEKDLRLRFRLVVNRLAAWSWPGDMSGIHPGWRRNSTIALPHGGFKPDFSTSSAQHQIAPRVDSLQGVS
jgi:hypothetical protein